MHSKAMHGTAPVNGIYNIQKCWFKNVVTVSPFCTVSFPPFFPPYSSLCCALYHAQKRLLYCIRANDTCAGVVCMYIYGKCDFSILMSLPRSWCLTLCFILCFTQRIACMLMKTTHAPVSFAFTYMDNVNFTYLKSLELACYNCSMHVGVKAHAVCKQRCRLFAQTTHAPVSFAFTWKKQKII